MDICQIGYDICEFDSLRGLGVDIIGRVHFDNRDRFVIWMGSIGKATEPCQQTSGCWHLTFDSFLNLDMGDDTNTKFLFMIDHVGIYGSTVAEGLSAFNVGLVWKMLVKTPHSLSWREGYRLTASWICTKYPIMLFTMLPREWLKGSIQPRLECIGTCNQRILSCTTSKLLY